MSSRWALLRHLWAMVQTRAEAAGLVARIQQAAIVQGVVYGAVAAVAALSFVTASIVWLAVVAPAAWRGAALGLVALALLAAAVYFGFSAGRRVRRDARRVADVSRGLKLDFAMIDLAFKDAHTSDQDELAARERAKTAVREAAAAKAAAPSTAEGGVAASPGGPTIEAAAGAMRAAAPRPDVPPAEAPATGTAVATAGGMFASTSVPPATAAGAQDREPQTGKYSHHGSA